VNWPLMISNGKRELIGKEKGTGGEPTVRRKEPEYPTRNQEALRVKFPVLETRLTENGSRETKDERKEHSRAGEPSRVEVT